MSPDPAMKEINPATPLTDQARDEIAALAARQRRAGGVLMKAITFVGGQVESGLRMVPKGFRDQIEAAARTALEISYTAASRSRGGAMGRAVAGDRMHKMLATLSGAIGGFGGLTTALAELPVATTVIFRAVQGVAAEYGEDPLSVETRLECLRVFGSGAEGPEDDGIDTSFLGARIGLTGPALHKLLSRVAPRFATVLSQKLAAQAVPVLGAAAGAGTNYAFVDYYTEIAHVHFGLRKLSREFGEAQVIDEFHRLLGAAQVPVNRAG